MMMKKMLLLFAVLAMMSTAMVGQELDRRFLDTARLITARQVNYFSLKSEKNAEPFYQAESCPNIDLDSLNKVVGSFSRNMSLTSFIIGSGPNSDMEACNCDSLIEFFSNKIFEKSQLASFVDKRETEGSMEQIKAEIFNELSSGFQKINKEIERANNQTIEIIGQEEDESLHVNWWGAIATFFAIIFAALCVWLYIRLKNTTTDRNELSRKYGDRSDENELLKQNLYKLERDNKELRATVNDLNGEVDAKNAEILSMMERTRKKVDSTPCEPVSCAHNYYASVPYDNMFVNTVEEYLPSKSLFKIVTTNDESGEFEFISNAETVRVAQQSRTIFLEAACYIINDDVNVFSSITTEQRGEVVRTGTGWNIVKKAQIRLN